MSFGYIERVPWHLVRAGIAAYRVAQHTVEKPDDVPRLIVYGLDEGNIPPERALRYVLGRRSFGPNWELSVYYKGEIQNLRRTEFRPEIGPPEIEEWQNHIRAFDHPDGLEVLAHWEPEPTEHPDEHLSEEYMDVERGTRRLESILDEEGIEYDRR
ncbi:hypothetical protein [Halopelagius fulvigenes]|uniref:Uncharacterized protein n=1 Tax=Halopelagius fulvigenes TaxID=1198324 RepID=A0ABD5U1C9_9EURY